MHRIRLMLFAKYIGWFRDLRILMSFLLGFSLVSAPCVNLSRLSILLNAPVQPLEPMILIGSTYNQYVFTLLGLFLLLSNAPFMNDMTIYETLRVGKKRWVTTQILYISISSAIYYVALALFTILLTVLVSATGITFQNVWGSGMKLLATQSPQFAIEKLGLLFPFPEFLDKFSPVSAFFLTAASNILYGAILCLGLFVFNLKGYGSIGWAFMIILHIWGYLVMMNGPSHFLPYLSPIILAMPGYSSFGPPYIPLEASMATLLFIALLFIIYGLRTNWELK